MNASKLLKAVLRPRALQTNGGRAPTATHDGPSSRRSLSPDSRLPVAGGAKRSSTPVKMTCMCSPTSHPGSFRCRYHRQQKEQAMMVVKKVTKKAAAVRDSDILSEVTRCLPGAHPASSARVVPVRCSRLRNMTLGSGLEEEEDLRYLDGEMMRKFTSPVATAARPQALKKDLPREIPTMFCQSTSRKALDAFDRNMTRMYL